MATSHESQNDESKSSNIPRLKRYGKQLLGNVELNLAPKRRSFVFDFEPTAENIVSFIRGMGYDFTDIDIIDKTWAFSDTKTKIGLKDHVDDCQLVHRKEPPSYNGELYMRLDDDYYLYFNNKFRKLPLMTFIFYMSTYGTDFNGGILRLADDTEIFAQAGHGFVIDSKEVHMVTPITKGTRRSIVVKIY